MNVYWLFVNDTNKVLCSFLLFLLISLISQAFSLQPPSTNTGTNTNTNLNKDPNAKPKLINRKVLILDFVNMKNLADYEYLENSLPESISSSLDKSRKFTLLSRSIWNEAVKKGIYQKNDAMDESKAIELAQKSGADVVLVGSFLAQEGKMQIFAKVFEVESRRVMINRREKAVLDSTMFDSIDNLANELAAEMTEKLPPVEQSVIVKNQIIFQGGSKNWNDKKFSVAFLPGFFIHNSVGCDLCEIPLALDFRYRPFHSSTSFVRNIHGELKLDYTRLWDGSVSSGNNTIGLINAVVYAGYGFHFGRLAAHVGFGAGYFSTFNVGVARNMLLEARFGSDFLITSSSAMGLQLYWRMHNDNESPLHFWGTGPSVSFVF
ncbi:MAG: hypothetical protein OEV66_07050 [Spirochaetia bacterium]|nr:hypothetical protein [Spirochaetia bacterium]